MDTMRTVFSEIISAQWNGIFSVVVFHRTTVLMENYQETTLIYSTKDIGVSTDRSMKRFVHNLLKLSWMGAEFIHAC